MKIFPLCLAMLLGNASFAADTNASAAAGADYLRTITQRADKIVAPLGLTETNQALRVRALLVRQYQDLAKVHAERDARIRRAKEQAGGDKAAATAAVQAVRDETKPQLDQLHAEFLARLAAELSPGQIEQVKNGLTYGVAPNTYAVYLKMYPELTAAQQAQIQAWLHEARELAMDGSTSDEKHAIFGKYKGRINNYLSKAGYDAKKGEQNLKKSAAPASNSTPK